MDSSGLLAVLQINVALGILYVSLKDLRFRGVLYGRISSLLDVHQFSKLYEPESKDIRLQLLDSNPIFSKHCHTIRSWILELPESYQDRISDVLFSIRQTQDISQKSEAHQPNSEPLDNDEPDDNKLLKQHRLFRDDTDKAWVWRVTILPSLMALWIFVFPSLSSIFLCVVACAIIAFLGQSTLVYFYFVGRRVSQKPVSILADSLEIVMKIYWKNSASQRIRGAVQRRPRA